MSSAWQSVAFGVINDVPEVALGYSPSAAAAA
jgi:hypothetical protein